MNGRLSRFSLPLLMKELIEQSARRRLFIVRVCYAVLLFTIATAFILPEVYRQPLTPVARLGIGMLALNMMVMLQFTGIMLFLPAMACGVITTEKERSTLPLLFLTRLGPWTIILEKFCSRTAPMLSLLLISLPLLAFTYSLGGINTFDLISGVWWLTLSVVQVTAFAVLASAWCRSTVSAFLTTYAFIFLVCFGPLTINSLFLNQGLSDGYSDLGQTYLKWLLGPEAHIFGQYAVVLFLPVGIFEILTLHGAINRIPWGGFILFLSGIPTLISAIGALVLARMCLVQRAFLPPKNPLLNLFKLLDRVLVQANSRYTRGIVLVRESHTLPEFQPVAWRETAKRSLGQFRYLVRIFILLELPVLSFAVMGAADRAGMSSSTASVSLLLGLIWGIVILIVCTSAATAFSQERGRQTLDVLLTTPLSSRQIILEKLSGVKRLILACAVPLGTCIAFQTWWRAQLSPLADHDSNYALSQTNGYRTQYYLWHEYLIGSVLCVVIYLHLVAWLALWLGIRTASPSRAIMSSLATVVAWCAIPPLALGAFFNFVLRFDTVEAQLRASYQGIMLALLSSPLMLTYVSETGGVRWLHPMPYMAVIVNTLIYGSLWLVIRWHVLRRADQYLGRTSTRQTKVTASAISSSDKLDEGSALRKAAAADC